MHAKRGKTLLLLVWIFFFTWLFVSKSLVHVKNIFILLTAVRGCVLKWRNQHKLFKLPIFHSCYNARVLCPHTETFTNL